MATGGIFNRVRKVFKRYSLDGASSEDSRHTGNNAPKQSQIESNVPIKRSPAAEEEEQRQSRGSDVRDTDKDTGTSTREATACELGSSSNMELSCPQQGVGEKLNRVWKILKSFLPGGQPTEDDRDTGNNGPKQGQMDSNVLFVSGPAAEEEEQIQPRDSGVRDTDQDPGTSTSEATVCQPRDSDVRDTDQEPGTSTSEATVCQPRDSDVGDTDQDHGTSTSEATVCQLRDSDVRDTDQDHGTSTSEATVCQPRDSVVGDTDQDLGTSTSEATACQPRDSDVRDTDQDPGTSTSEATVCQLGSSSNIELSSPQQGVGPSSAITELLASWNDFQLLRLTDFYRDRLEQAMEGGVHGVSLALKAKNQFSGEKHRKISDLADKGERADSSKLLLSLVMEKGSRARRVMWETFVKMRIDVPKFDKILKEIQEHGCVPVHQPVPEIPSKLKDVQQKHKETLRAQTETLRVNTILMREKVKVFQLVDRYAELTVISTVRDRRLVEHELLARGRDHEELRKKHLRRELEKIRSDQLFQSSFSRSKSKSGSSAAVAGVPGIGKTTMVQKIVYDWAMGKIYEQFQFVFSFKFRDLNSINCRINLRELILDRYPYFGKILREVWKISEGLLFIFDGLDEFKHRIDFADSRRHTEPKHMCPDPERWCEVSDIVYSLIQGKLLPGCSVLVTTRPTALHLLEKAKIGVWAEILGFVGEERKEYFIRHFEDQKVAAAVFKHVKENEILYTMSYNPSYCWILALALGPFFTQRIRDTQRVPKTITQLFSYYIYNILKNHGREIENSRDVLLKVGQMAFRGVSERKIAFTDGDLINYKLQPSQFLSGFLMELLEREDCARSVVYTFPHLTIQEFVAAVALFLSLHPKKILKFLIEAHNTTNGRFEVILRFVAGLSNPMTARGLEEFLGPFPHDTTCQVIDWVKEEVKRQIKNTWSEAGKRSFLNTLHYLFESQNSGLAQAALGSVETLSFSEMTLTPIDCAVLSHSIGLCDTIKQLDLAACHIQCEGIQRLGPGLHKCRELRLAMNKLGESGVKLVSAALRNPECKIQKLWLFNVGLTDSGAEGLVSALSTNRSLTGLDLTLNSLTDRSVPALRRLILTLPSLEWILLVDNQFSESGRKELRSLQELRHGLRISV
ncbi:NACHT, LRR and PYD domains-containing protein 3-like [Hemitrygon akajei]|uniref:NACHT, LRR and PYD domains-containing protein 3-like n=1 Tax=Hemitrygon akajei TaxID=2704970 RepID=UPI003BF9FD96